MALIVISSILSMVSPISANHSLPLLDSVQIEYTTSWAGFGVIQGVETELTSLPSSGRSRMGGLPSGLTQGMFTEHARSRVE